MGAIVVDLKDMGVRTPGQSVRVFYATYDPESVKAGLWEAFRGFSLAAENFKEKELPDMKETALLFDGLISLVNAVYVLREQTNGRCVICGRGDDSSFHTKGGGDGDDVPGNAG
jgi:hypothetical protein